MQTGEKAETPETLTETGRRIFRALTGNNAYGLRMTSILFLWIYDAVKLILGYKIMLSHNINPWIFAFIDFATVPTYINGWAKMFSFIKGKTEPFPVVLKWTAITFISSTGPYMYAAWAGRQSLPAYGWLIIVFLAVFPVINQIRRMMSQEDA